MDTKYVLPEDHKMYSEFLQHHFTELATQRPFPPLYHYTSGESLIEIIRHGELWTTQIACLSDTKELVHAVDVFVAAISEREKQGVDSEFAALLEKMRELLRNPVPEVSGVFVACFSECKDDLSQWRAYGGPDGGYAIEFDLEALLQSIIDAKGGYLVPVTYDSNIKYSLIGDVLKWTEKFFRDGLVLKRAPSLEEWVDEFAVCWLGYLSHLAPMLKHPAFKDEQEWRLIYFLKEEEVIKMQFTERSSMMRRHLPKSFSDPDKNGYTPLPIKGVTVGQKTYQALSSIAVGDLLKSRGYAADQVPVTLSAIPFRTAR